MGIVLGEDGDALELAGLTGEELVHLDAALLDLALETGELVLLAIERVAPAVEGLLALHDAILHGLELLLALALLALGPLLELNYFLTRLDEGRLLGGLGITARIVLYPGRLASRRLDGTLGLLHLRVVSRCRKEVRRHGTDDQTDHSNDDFHLYPLRCSAERLVQETGAHAYRNPPSEVHPALGENQAYREVQNAIRRRHSADEK